MEKVFLLLRTVPLQDCVKAELKEWLAGHAFCRGKFVGPIQQKAVRLEAMLNPFLCNGMMCWQGSGRGPRHPWPCIMNRLKGGKHNMYPSRNNRMALLDVLGYLYVYNYNGCLNIGRLHGVWMSYCTDSLWMKVHQGWTASEDLKAFNREELKAQLSSGNFGVEEGFKRKGF